MTGDLSGQLINPLGATWQLMIVGRHPVLAVHAPGQSEGEYTWALS